ncbi:MULTISPECIES: TetR/AcrR family transcriptional regulator [unclassified Cupriavidus]|uniref:TetR/AcrR family transcriptional regulator n=1 Tax=unclassified Cupriavidus TaxID=2640874 RepID=UPI00313DBBB4
MARPRQFDEQAALMAAQDLFWAKGYQATSTRELTQTMGLTQPSLYNAFGDKRSLFLLALDDYLNRTMRERIRRHEGALPPGRALVAYIAESIALSLADPRHRGCMLINVALEASEDDPEFKSLIATELDQLRAFFERCIQAGIASGEVVTALAPEDASAQLLATHCGMRVLARVMPDPALLRATMKPALAMLGLALPDS